VLEDIKKGNTRTKWKDRVPYAYWKGNPSVAPTRNDLLKCNVSDKDDWNTHLYIQVIYILLIYSQMLIVLLQIYVAKKNFLYDVL